jgi:hypothetical protein
MRSRSIAVVAVLALGCLPAFAPGLRARGIHAGLDRDSPRTSCMTCHESEAEALARASTSPSKAPLVAEWMLTERRSCVNCHHVHQPIERARVRVLDRLEVDLSEVPRGS